MTNIFYKFYSYIFIIIYILHFTIAQVFILDLTNLYYGILILGVIFTLNYNNKYSLIVFPLIISSILSLLLSIDLLPGTHLRWLSWIIIILFAAPIIYNKYIYIIRSNIWWNLLNIYVLISLVSFCWIIFKLPSFGVDEERFLGGGKYFRNGVTTHEMILAPVATISSIYILCLLILKKHSTKKNIIYIFVEIILIITILMASSRTCVAGFILIALLIFYKERRKVFTYLFRRLEIVISIIIVLISSFIFLQADIDSFIKSNSRLESKGLNNSRQELWDARINDAQINILSGAGFHSVSREVIKVHTFNGVNLSNGRVEFGSLYLQALSTMGILGLFSLVYLVIKVSKHDSRYIEKDYKYKILLYCFYFLIFHSIFEAYAFSAGAFFCIFFWLNISTLYHWKLNSIKNVS